MKVLEKLLNKCTLFFLFLIPFFLTTFFHSQLTTLFEVIVIIMIFILTIIVYPESRKNIKYLLCYLLLVLTYILISYWHQASFKSLVPGNFNYSLLKEFLTYIKLVIPVFFIYSLYYQKIEKKDYLKIINIWILLMAGSIIITNIFKISYSSYSNELITENIFAWGENIYYLDTASRGLFTYANQISAIMIMLLLISIYEFLYVNKKYIFNILFLFLAMVMLGTRVSTIGGLLTLVCAFFFYIFISVKDGSNSIKCLGLIVPIGLWILLIPISPFANRNSELNTLQEKTYVDNSSVINTENVLVETIENDPKSEYVYNNYNPNYLPKVFFEEYYPIDYDLEFWYDFLNRYQPQDMNYRLIEMSIIKRVVEINDNSLDKFLGISNVRIQNIVNIERDFVLHYYAFGLIGMILLLIMYPIMCILGLNKFFKEKNYFSFTIVTSILLFIFCAYLTGNIINSLTVVIPFCFIASSVFLEE